MEVLTGKEMEVEVDENIKFCMSLRGKTFLDGNEKNLIKNVHFDEKFEELVATLVKVNKRGISKVENVQSVAEIFAMDTNE